MTVHVVNRVNETPNEDPSLSEDELRTGIATRSVTDGLAANLHVRATNVHVNDLTSNWSQRLRYTSITLSIPLLVACNDT